MTSEDWNAGFAKSLGVFLNGDALPDPDRRGHRISDDSFLLLFNAHYEDEAAAGGNQGRGRRPRCADIPARVAVIPLRACAADYF
jgi:hypothetical protein